MHGASLDQNMAQILIMESKSSKAYAKMMQIIKETTFIT